MLREVRERTYEALHGPAHRWERPLGSAAIHSQPSGASSGDADEAGAGNPPTRLSSAGMSDTSKESRHRNVSVGDQGSPSHRGMSSHRSSHGSDTYRRYRFSEDTTSGAGVKAVVGITRVNLDVHISAREPQSESSTNAA